MEEISGAIIGDIFKESVDKLVEESLGTFRKKTGTKILRKTQEGTSVAVHARFSKESLETFPIRP